MSHSHIFIEINIKIPDNQTNNHITSHNINQLESHKLFYRTHCKYIFEKSFVRCFRWDLYLRFCTLNPPRRSAEKLSSCTKYSLIRIFRRNVLSCSVTNLTHFKTPKYHIKTLKVIFTPKTLVFNKITKLPLENPKNGSLQGVFGKLAINSFCNLLTSNQWEKLKDIPF